jgi:homogentisate 1,2-dioxygenase
MPFYVRQGRIPSKRHSVFKKDGTGLLHYEELMGRAGFSGVYTNMYHLKMPTRVRAVGRFEQAQSQAVEAEHRHRHIRTSKIRSSGDPVSSRRLLLFNSDVRIYKCHPDAGMDYFYRNGHCDELYYVQSGLGVLETILGRLEFGEGDYVLIPRGILWKMSIKRGQGRFLLIETSGPIEIPTRYRNRQGQLLEHSPYCERDIRLPTLGPAKDEDGRFKVKVRLDHGCQDYVYASHPFDVVGWDGCHYPWIFSIHDFEPIVGSLHQPPSVHQTFESSGVVVCSFVSRPFDFRDNAIPAPYPHSNVDSDEVLFYSKGQFMSRKGISAESITFHPMGLPHGPHPGLYEASIGAKSTDELAVMIDTFQPLKLARVALEADDKEYPLSWLENTEKPEMRVKS